MHRLARMIGVWLLLFAMVAAVVDATKSLGANGRIVMTPLAAQWQSLFPQSFDWLQQTAAAKLGPVAWNEAVLPVLDLPTWLILGVLGVLFYWAGQKRRTEQVFIN